MKHTKTIVKQMISALISFSQLSLLFLSLCVYVIQHINAGLPFPMPDAGLKYLNEIASVQQQQSSSVQPLFSFPYTTSSPLPYFQMPSGKNTEVTQLHTVKKKMAKWND